MLSRRLVVCLDVQDGRVVKGVQFRHLRDIGDPVTLASDYENQSADEIVYLDVSATVEGRRTFLDLVRRTAEGLFIPLTVGGGVRSADDVGRVLRAGADKVCLNSAIIARPEIISESARRFGSQCVVASIDALREGEGWTVYSHGGRVKTALDVVAWAHECVARGAGEIVLTSIDRDGSRSGYDLELLRAVTETVTVPVVASGGAGSAQHVVSAFTEGGADAALVAGIVHDGATSIAEIKQAMAAANLPVREVALV